MSVRAWVVYGVVGCLGLMSACAEEQPVPPAPPSADRSYGVSGGAGGRDDDDLDGTAGAGGAFEGDGSSDGQGDSQALLVGRYRQQFAGCAYTHTFTSGGDYTIEATSGERVEAEYTLMRPTDSVPRHRLDITITYDNNAVDCEGHRIDETGNFRTAYLEFVGDVVEFYRGPMGGSLGFAIERVR